MKCEPAFHLNNFEYGSVKTDGYWAVERESTGSNSWYKSIAEKVNDNSTDTKQIPKADVYLHTKHVALMLPTVVQRTREQSTQFRK